MSMAVEKVCRMAGVGSTWRDPRDGVSYGLPSGDGSAVRHAMGIVRHVAGPAPTMVMEMVMGSSDGHLLHEIALRRALEATQPRPVKEALAKHRLAQALAIRAMASRVPSDHQVREYAWLSGCDVPTFTVSFDAALYHLQEWMRLAIQAWIEATK